MDSVSPHDLDVLIDALQNEIQECGELLSLFRDQEAAILDRNHTRVRATQAAIVEQTGVIEEYRSRRERTKRAIAKSLGRTPVMSIRALIDTCAEPTRPLLHALVDEVSQLTLKTRRHARQNERLLARSAKLH